MQLRSKRVIEMSTESRIAAIENTLQGMSIQLKLLDKLNVLDGIVKEVASLKKDVQLANERSANLEAKLVELTKIKPELQTAQAEILCNKNTAATLRKDFEFMFRSMHRDECEIAGLPDVKGMTPK